MLPGTLALRPGAEDGPRREGGDGVHGALDELVPGLDRPSRVT